MYTDVIIGFDGSPAGHDALALGRRLARSTGASTTVVYVHPYQALTANVLADSAIELSWRTGAERVLDEARRALDDLSDVSFRAKPETSPARALHEIAREAAAAVIVVGSTHRKALGRVVPGTTADRILHGAPCAIAVAPAGYADRDPGSPHGVVGAAVDGGKDTERVARIAAGIARRAKARLRLLTVADIHRPPRPISIGQLEHPSVRAAIRSAAHQALERATVAAGAGVVVERRVVEGDPVGSLLAESNGLDLLVVGSRAYGPVRRVVLGRVGAPVLRDAACPVLAIPRCMPAELDASIPAVARAAAR
jgi:nucleotide-binding universal stress UspA family protein